MDIRDDCIACIFFAHPRPDDVCPEDRSLPGLAGNLIMPYPAGDVLQTF